MPHHHESTHSSFFLLATSATGPHPFPSRTRSLSLSASMVLPLRGGGRVDRRQRLIRSPLQSTGAGFWFYAGSPSSPSSDVPSRFNAARSPSKSTGFGKNSMAPSPRARLPVPGSRTPPLALPGI